MSPPFHARRPLAISCLLVVILVGCTSHMRRTPGSKGGAPLIPLPAPGVAPGTSSESTPSEPATEELPTEAATEADASRPDAPGRPTVSPTSTSESVSSPSVGAGPPAATPPAGSPDRSSGPPDPSLAGGYVYAPSAVVPTATGTGTDAAAGSAPPAAERGGGEDPAERSAPAGSDKAERAEPPPNDGARDPLASPGVFRLSIAPSPVVAGVGDVFTVDVLASSGDPVLDAPFHVRFDPTILSYVDAAPGDFLARDGSSVVFLADGTTRPGDVSIAIGRTDRGSGATGQGLLCRVRLLGVARGISSLVVADPFAWNERGAMLTVLTSAGSVAVE